MEVEETVMLPQIHEDIAMLADVDALDELDKLQRHQPAYSSGCGDYRRHDLAGDQPDSAFRRSSDKNAYIDRGGEV